MEPVFFATAAEFRRWLTRHHATESELWVGYYKKGSGHPSLTYQESLDEALCFGWIDGVRKSLDAERYVNRFTPRKAVSNWSEANRRRMQELIAEGRIAPAGLRAFEARDAKKPAAYSFEQRKNPEFDEAALKTFKASKEAWRFFQAQPPGYRRVVTWWVVSAKQAATRQRRLKTLIDESAAGRRIDFMQPWKGKAKP